MSLLDVKHQPRAHRAIQRAIAGGRIPHAYIFHGPDGVGKETFARGLAQFLLCPNAPTEPRPSESGLFSFETEQPYDERAAREGRRPDAVAHAFAPCGHCDDCRMVAAETHPDWHLVYRQLNREHPDPEVRRRKGLDIGVDVLRHFVIDKVGFTPIRGRAKMFVIREADRITTQAQNALLKTLEEPPGITYLLLLVTSIDRLLPTTLSRCQVIAFDPLPSEFVLERMRAIYPDLVPNQAEWSARFADGSIGAAIQAVEEHLFDVHARVRGTLIPQPAAPPRSATVGRAVAEPLLVAHRSQCLKAWTEEVVGLGELYRKRDSDISDTEATRRGWKTVFRLLAENYAELLRVASDSIMTIPSDPCGTGFQPVRKADSERFLADALGPERAADAIQRIAQAERHLDLNANTQLVVETLANDLAHIQSGGPIAVS